MTITVKKILIVDDSAVVRRNLKKLISTQTGIFSIVEAETVHSAIQQIRDERPQVVVVDLQVSGDTGFEILEFIARREHAPVVIVLTNSPNAANRRYADSLGVRYFFDKSFEYENVIHVLNETPIASSNVPPNGTDGKGGN